MKILTVTLNPCVDRTEWVKDFDAPPARVEYQTGGKGVNCARVLSNFGVDCAALVPLGGKVGEQFRALSRAEGIALLEVPIAAQTRTVVTRALLGTSDGVGRVDKRVTFGHPPEISEAELSALDAAAEAALAGAQCLVVGGSACCARAAAWVPELIGRAKALGVRTVLDSNGEALRLGAEAKPDLIKPNVEELAQLLGRSIAEGEEECAALELLKRGVGAVLLSMGARGAALFEGANAFYCPAATVQPVNEVGSGDSFLAAWLYASLSGFTPYMALAVGCAAGAANARQFPAARVTKREVGQMLGYAI